MVDGWMDDPIKRRLAAKACNQSHLLAIETAYNRKSERVLILEDDAFFVQDGKKIVEKSLDQLSEIPDWDIFYLGANLSDEEINLISDNLIKCTYLFCAHGYILNRKSMRHILENRSTLETGEKLDDIDIFLPQQLKNKYLTYPLALVQREDVVSDLAGGRPGLSTAFWENSYKDKKINYV